VEIDLDRDQKVYVTGRAFQLAKHLGNTPAVCRESSIHPRILTLYQQGKTLANFRQQLKADQKFMTKDEQATLILLESL